VWPNSRRRHHIVAASRPAWRIRTSHNGAFRVGCRTLPITCGEERTFAMENSTGSEPPGALDGYADIGPRRGDWHKRAVCPECYWHCEAPFGDLFHVHVKCCPRCGAEKGTYQRGNLAGNKSWEIETMRYHKECQPLVWWKPSTWFASSGRWLELYSSRGTV
jgi:hypothetical protein